MGSDPSFLFQLAVEVLQHLSSMRSTTTRCCNASGLAHALQVDVLQLEPILETLAELDWVGQLIPNSDDDAGAESNQILVADPENTKLEPLMQRLLLDKTDSTLPLWAAGQRSHLKLKKAL